MTAILTTWDCRAQYAQRADGQWFRRERPLRRGRCEYGAWYAVDVGDVPKELITTTKRVRLPRGEAQ